jgi:hypothetical protein
VKAENLPSFLRYLVNHRQLCVCRLTASRKLKERKKLIGLEFELRTQVAKRVYN